MKRGKRVHAKTSSPKRSLNLPDLDQAKSAVLNSLPSKESQRGYRHAIDEFIAGTAPNLDCRSTRPLSPALEFIWNHASLRRARSTADSQP